MVRVGIIGSGAWAGRYGAALQESQKAKLVAVAGGSRAGAYAEKLGIRRAPSPEALCAAKDVDIVAVVCPHGYHAEHAIRAAENGKHVIVEKPMATSVAECDQMIAAAERNGVKLMVAHSRRFFPRTYGPSYLFQFFQRVKTCIHHNLAQWPAQCGNYTINPIGSHPGSLRPQSLNLRSNT